MALVDRHFLSQRLFLNMIDYVILSLLFPLLQVEYAIEAIKLGSTAVGLQTKEGCVLAVEKRLTSPLLDPNSVEKIAEIDHHIGAAMSGLVADAKTLVDHARVEAQNHTFTYDEPIGVEPLTQGELILGATVTFRL